MALLRKLAIRFATFVVMVALMGCGLRYAIHGILRASGVQNLESVRFSSDEAELMGTVFKSAIRLLSGAANRKELAAELSEKLYGGKGNKSEMSELGIELESPGGETPVPAESGGAGKLGGKTEAKRGSKLASKPEAKSAAETEDQEEPASKKSRGAVIDKLCEEMKVYSVELTMVPIVLVGMGTVHLFRRRPRGSDFAPTAVGIMPPAESEPYEMKHDVHSLSAEEFEMLVALIYQRQGYRILLPAAAGGGKGGDFMMVRKAERILVQCKKVNGDHKLPVDRVRELHEAMTAVGATKGLYVASCRITWDARNFAKTKGMTVINGRTLDELLSAARQKPDEDLLNISAWAPTFMRRVELTPPHCPSCEAAMEHVSASRGSVWLCSQRPECRGRRNERKYQKLERASAASGASIPAAGEGKLPKVGEEEQIPEAVAGKASGVSELPSAIDKATDVASERKLPVTREAKRQPVVEVGASVAREAKRQPVVETRAPLPREAKRLPLIETGAFVAREAKRPPVVESGVPVVRDARRRPVVETEASVGREAKKPSIAEIGALLAGGRKRRPVIETGIHSEGERKSSADPKA